MSKDSYGSPPAPNLIVNSDLFVKPDEMMVSTLEAKRSIALKVLEACRIVPDEILQFGVELAKEIITSQAVMAGLPLEDIVFPDYFFIQRADLTSFSASDHYFRNMCDMKFGCFMPSINIAMIGDKFENGSVAAKTFAASSLYHEFIHAVIELKVAISNQNKDNHEYQYFDVRSGLEVKHSNAEFGLFLNEHINYGFQIDFERELRRRNASYNEEYSNFIESLRDTFEPDPEAQMPYIMINVERADGSISFFHVDSETFPFDSGGRPFGLTAILKRQIYLEIIDRARRLLGEEAVQNLKKCMLRAKADPSNQGELRDFINLVCGRSFYRRLKHLPDNVDSMVDLLLDLQADTSETQA